MTNPARQRLAPERAALVVVDIQERLAAAMDAEALSRVERNVCVLVELARRLSIPVVATEQYPQGLGRTRPAVAEALAGLEGGEAVVGGVTWLEKLAFSACECDAFSEVWEALTPERTQWIVTGMEAHVCVFQTARDLASRGVVTHVPRDAVISRSEENRQTGLELMGRAGALVTSTETVVFDALRAAGTEDFKALSKLLR